MLLGQLVPANLRHLCLLAACRLLLLQFLDVEPVTVVVYQGFLQDNVLHIASFEICFELAIAVLLRA